MNEYDIMRENFAHRGLGGLARNLSNASAKLMSVKSASGKQSTPIETSSRPSSSASSPPSPSVSILPSLPPVGSAKKYRSRVTNGKIIESTAPSKYFVESSYCTNTVATCEVKFRETSADNLAATLDTAASSSFISAYEARVKFDPSDIKTLRTPMDFETAAGSVHCYEYVVADMYFPCSVDATNCLAKATVVLFLQDGRLPSGSDILLGMDFLIAQRISILLPRSSAIMGTCGNAEIPLIFHKNNDFPVYMNAPDLTPAARASPKFKASHRRDPSAPRAAPATRPKITHGETNYFMMTSPASTANNKARAKSDNKSNRNKPLQISGPTSARVQEYHLINGHPNPLRSNPGPGVWKDPATAFAAMSLVPHLATPSPQVSPPTVNSVSTATNSGEPTADVPTISNPISRPRPFTISDAAALIKPRSIPGIPEKQTLSQKARRLGKIFRSGKSDKTSVSSSSSSSSSSGSDSDSSERAIDPPKLARAEVVIAPHTQLGTDMATKVACESEFGGKSF